MKIRGERECQDCGTQWSYYTTGNIQCPNCGSIQSVGLDAERTLHTATDTAFELTPLRNDLETATLRQLAERAVDQTRRFTRRRGFIDAGVLDPLDDTFLAAMELKLVAAELARKMEISPEEEWYFTELLRADTGHRPDPDSVPPSLHHARGLAYANAVRQYRSDLRTYLDERPDPAVDGYIEQLTTHVKRIRALDGEVSPDHAESVIQATRNITRYLTDDEETALTETETYLSNLS